MSQLPMHTLKLLSSPFHVCNASCACTTAPQQFHLGTAHGCSAAVAASWLVHDTLLFLPRFMLPFLLLLLRLLLLFVLQDVPRGSDSRQHLCAQAIREGPGCQHDAGRAGTAGRAAQVSRGAGLCPQLLSTCLWVQGVQCRSVQPWLVQQPYLAMQAGLLK